MFGPMSRTGENPVSVFLVCRSRILRPFGSRGNFFHLPYFNARIVTSDVGGLVHYAAQRGSHEFVAEYRPGPLAPSRPDSFSAWATERYCLYSSSADGRIFRGEIHHIKWPLQQATIDVRINTLAGYPLGPMHPEVLFSRRVDVVLWSLEQIN